MSTEHWLKLLGILVVVLVIGNLLLFALKLISVVLFWIVIIVAAIVAYKLLPRMRTP